MFRGQVHCAVTAVQYEPSRACSGEEGRWKKEDGRRKMGWSLERRLGARAMLASYMYK